MAQLVKLYNYISRYERDIYHYPSRFIRLKRENWKKTNFNWNEDTEQFSVPIVEEEEVSKRKSIFKRKNKQQNQEEVEELYYSVPLTEKEKKQQFLDSLFPFQLRWASTTVSQMSFLDDDFKRDPLLKYFLQRFPDTYLLFYYPVFSLKNNPMETDILLVGPYGIDIIKIIEKKGNVRYTAADDRVWYEETGETRKRIVSPTVSLNRTENVVKGILNLHESDFPVHKTVLSRTSKIKYNQEGYNTSYIGSDHHSAWLDKKKTNAHLLKHRQLQVCELLLAHCDQVAFRRPEWEEYDSDQKEF